MTKVPPLVKEKHSSGLVVRRRGNDAYIVFKTGAVMKLEDYEKMMSKKQKKKQ